MLPGVWPGVWMTSSPPSTGRTSPSATGVSQAHPGSGQASVDEGQTIFEDHIPASAQKLDLVDAGGDLHDRQTPGAELRDARTSRIERDALAGLDQPPEAIHGVPDLREAGVG